MSYNRALRLLPPVVILVFTIGFLVLTYQLPAASRSAPLMVAWVTLFLTAVDVITRLRNPLGNLLMRLFNPAGLREEDTAPTREEVRHTLQAIGMMALLVAALLLIGVLPASGLFIGGAFIYGGSTRRLAVIVAAVFTLLLWAVFSELLGLVLFPGLLFGGLI